MKYKTYALDENGDAKFYSYILNSQISHGVNKKRPAIVICPGGGYLTTAIKEGEAVAVSFLSKGYNAFVLEYSVYFKDRILEFNESHEINEKAVYPRQVYELIEVLNRIQKNADSWNIDIDNVFILGFSAGAHVCATLGTRWHSALFNKLKLKIKGMILCYPMLNGNLESHMANKVDKEHVLYKNIKYFYETLYHTDSPDELQIENADTLRFINEKTVATFLWHTNMDEITNPADSVNFITLLQKYGVPCEFHLFEQGRHGLALGTKEYAKKEEDIDDNIATWFPLAIHWLSKQLNKHED